MSTNRIDLDRPRYDQSTYWGRLKHFSAITSPLNLFATNSQLEAAKKLVDDYKAGKIDVEEDWLWKAKQLVDSTYHPDTGEKILLPFRMASFVPTNVAIVAGMLMPNPSIAGIIFWQWINQSVNVAFNYFNANKTTTMNMRETATAYATAVGSSCAIAVGMNEYVKRARNMSPSTRAMLGRAVPFVAVAAAGTLNVILMRQKELSDGIDVTDEEGNTLGKSTVAGRNAIAQVSISRIATAFPVVFIPSLIMSRIDKTAFIKRSPRLRTPINLATITTSLLAALPCAVALFPQRASIRVVDLEERFRGVRGRDGRILERVWFNRGL